MAHIKGLRIVGADDNQVNIEILQKDLEYSGHTVKMFDEGEPIWNFMATHPESFDVVILDKMMRTLSGLQIAQKIRACPALKSKVIIIQSSDSDEQCIKEAYQLGVDAYLVKPYDSQQLLDAIDRSANKHHLA